MPSPDVVVTSLGVWSGAGISPETLFASTLAGTGLATMETVGDQATPLCRAPDPPVDPAFPQARRLDRAVQLALSAAAPAFQSARLDELDPQRVAVVVGNSRGPAGKLLEPPVARVRPSQAAHTAVASLSGALSLAFHVRGPSLTVSATCASAAHAIGLGAILLQSGLVDAVLAGGAEAPLVPGLLAQFTAAGIVGRHPDVSRTCRPFDVYRNGTVPGEGAAFLVLESAAGARARGRSAIARLAGFALGSESHNRVAARADGRGLIQVVEQAMSMAGVRPADLGYLNAHGTGTVVNDRAEGAAYRAALGREVGRIPVSSTKAVTGHAFGAAAALEAVITVLALRHQLAPPTAGCEIPDQVLGLDLILETPRPLNTRYAMSNSLGFWGNTACLIFEVTG